MRRLYKLSVSAMRVPVELHSQKFSARKQQSGEQLTVSPKAGPTGRLNFLLLGITPKQIELECQTAAF